MVFSFVFGFFLVIAVLLRFGLPHAVCIPCYDPVHAVSDLATLFIFSSFSFLLRTTRRIICFHMLYGDV